jgi:hypothetical protein
VRVAAPGGVVFEGRKEADDRRWGANVFKQGHNVTKRIILSAPLCQSRGPEAINDMLVGKRSIQIQMRSEMKHGNAYSTRPNVPRRYCHVPTVELSECRTSSVMTFDQQSIIRNRAGSEVAEDRDRTDFESKDELLSKQLSNVSA